jgi:hypothetical protein
MTPGNSIAPLASILACKNRRLDISAMTTPEKKPKKSARQCRSTAGRLYPEDECTAVGASSKMVNQIMQSECQVLPCCFRGANGNSPAFTHLNQAQNAR